MGVGDDTTVIATANGSDKAIYAKAGGIAISGGTVNATSTSGKGIVTTGTLSITGETTFSPNATCTRAQMVTFLFDALAE